MSERSWGTVREDYSKDGNAWDFLPHDHARSKAYRWGEDGIARAMTGDYRGGLSLWNDEDGFFYDALHLPDGNIVPLKVRSLVGLMPLLAVETLEHDLVESLPVFKRRLNWFLKTVFFYATAAMSPA